MGVETTILPEYTRFKLVTSESAEVPKTAKDLLLITVCFFMSALRPQRLRTFLQKGSTDLCYVKHDLSSHTTYPTIQCSCCAEEVFLPAPNVEFTSEQLS